MEYVSIPANLGNKFVWRGLRSIKDLLALESHVVNTPVGGTSRANHSNHPVKALTPLITFNRLYLTSASYGLQKFGPEGHPNLGNARNRFMKKRIRLEQIAALHPTHPLPMPQD